MTRERWMSVLFAVGSTCFLVGPFPGYADLVGARADAVTFFVGSIFFTGGGAMQVWLSVADRHDHGAGRTAWWAAVIQSAGTLFFNVTTFRALDTALGNPGYDGLVWRPDAFGSICFLVSGVIAYRGSPRHGLRPVRGTDGWWLPLVNLLGCVLFGISAIAGYVVPETGSEIDLAAANWNTSLGAACFLACALATIGGEPRSDRRDEPRREPLERVQPRGRHGLVEQRRAAGGLDRLADGAGPGRTPRATRRPPRPAAARPPATRRGRAPP